MRQEHKARQDIDQIAGLNRVYERLRGVHGQRFARRLAAPGVEDAADAVAPRIKIHQGIEVFPYISFFQFIAVHCGASLLCYAKMNTLYMHEMEKSRR